MTEECLSIVQWLKNWFTSTDDLIDKTYPVGSIYMSVNNTSPSTLFGGTWVQLTDTFLYASNTADTNSTTATDGEATHTLTTNEMPSHTHSPPSWVHYASSNGNTGNYSVTRVTANNGNTYVNSTPQTNKDTGSTGGGQAHNNMPPYMKVLKGEIKFEAK